MANLMNKDRMLERFLRYAQCSSESYHEKEFCIMIENELKEMGYPVIREEEVGKKIGSDGWNIITKIEGSDPSLSPILLSAHLDTVVPGVGIKPVIEDGFVRSSGDTILASDDKAGVAEIMELLETFKEKNIKPGRTVEVLFTLCEEVGGGAANADYSRFESKMGISLDYIGDNGIMTYCTPCFYRIEATIIGKPAHAATNPEDGINALRCASEIMMKLPMGHVDDISVMNAGEFKSMNKTNVVADNVSFAIEIRSYEDARADEHCEATVKLINEIAAKHNAKAVVNPIHGVYAVHIPEDSEIVTHCTACMEKLGVKPILFKSLGGSDATQFYMNGIDAFCISTGGDNAHTLTEFLEIEKFHISSDILWELVH